MLFKLSKWCEPMVHRSWDPSYGLHTAITTDYGCEDTLPADVVKAVQSTGGVVVIPRGGCAFWMKALVAQKAGATVCVVANAEGTPPDGQKNIFKIQSV